MGIPSTARGRLAHDWKVGWGLIRRRRITPPFFFNDILYPQYDIRFTRYERPATCDYSPRPFFLPCASFVLRLSMNYELRTQNSLPTSLPFHRSPSFCRLHKWPWKGRWTKAMTFADIRIEKGQAEYTQADKKSVSSVESVSKNSCQSCNPVQKIRVHQC